MRLTVSGAGQQQFNMQTGTLDGLLVSLTATTIGDWSVTATQTVQLIATLTRADGVHQILSGNLFALGTANNPSSYEGLTIGSYRSFQVSFGGVLNLKDGDSLQVTCSVGTAITGSVVTVSTSDVVGIEEYIPKVLLYTVDKTRSTNDITPGANVSKIALVQTTTDNTLTSWNIASDYYNAQLIESDFYAFMAEQWERAPENYSFVIFAGGPVNKCTMNLNVDTGSSGNGYVVVYCGSVTPETRNRASAAIAKVSDMAAQRYL